VPIVYVKYDYYAIQGVTLLKVTQTLCLFDNQMILHEIFIDCSEN